MNEPKQTAVEAFDLKVTADGLCEVCIKGELLPELVSAVMRSVQEQHQAPAALKGILLDVRRCAPLSMIRLSALMEQFISLNTPLAVVFLWHQQQELAILLHHTLPRRDRVAYYTELGEAWAYLRCHTLRRFSPGS